MKRTLLEVLSWVAALLLAANSIPVFAAPGDLDATFGGTGKVTTDFNGNSDSGQNVVVQSDGKIIVAGASNNGSNRDFAVVRYNTNGSLDTSFNGTGKVTTAIGNSDDDATCVAVQSDGKIVVAGHFINGVKGFDFAVVRYNANGSLDTTFNGSGKVITTISKDAIDDYVRSITIQGDGKILLAGVGVNPLGGSNYDFVVIRYNANGSVDTGFGTLGGVFTPVGNDNDQAASIQLQSDGKILVAGYSFDSGKNSFAVVRYTTSGTLDSAFGAGGKITTSIGGGAEGHSMVLQSNGKIVVAGESYNGGNDDFALVRYNADGSLDAGFGVGGKVTTALGSSGDEGYGVAVQIDGKIVVAGGSNNGSNDFALARYTTNGNLDATFNGTGKVTTPISNNSDVAFSIALQSDGKIVVAGSSNNGNSNDVAIARYIGFGPPVVITGGNDDITKTTATLMGSVNPGSSATTAFFQYGTTASYGSATGAQSVGSGEAAAPVESGITGLEPNTLYHYRLVASNFVGTTFGNDSTFTTEPDPPIAATGTAAAISSSGATLVGAVNPVGRDTDVQFEYGATELYGTTTPVQRIEAGSSVVDVFAPITGLIAGGRYYYRIVASNAGGSAVGDLGYFDATIGGGGGGMPTAKPDVATGTASDVAITRAMLQGVVNPKGGTTLAYYEFGLTASYGSQTMPQGVGSGPDEVGYARAVTGLQLGTTYHFRLIASNSLGTSTGADMTFMTLFPPPSATTDPAEPGTTFATLNGTVNPNALPTFAFFEYNMSPTLSGMIQTTPVQNNFAGTTVQPISTVVTGLVPQTQYYFRLKATSDAGSSPEQAIGTFTTLAAQAPMAVDDVVFTGGGNVSLNVIANDVNTDTGETGAGLTFDGVVRQGGHGQASGGPVVNFDPSGAFPLVGDSFDYRVKTAADLTDVGTVTVLPFGAFKGGYGGTITGGALTDGGLVTLELGPTGSFTGQLRWQNQKYALRDALESSGGRTITKQKIGAADGVDLLLALQLDRTGLIFADLLDEASGTTLSFVLRRAAASTSAVAGTYTATHAQPSGGLAELAPRGEGLGPQVVPGTGFTVGKVNKRKTSGRLVGRVGDSEPFSGGSKFFEDRLALNSKLYPTGRGAGRTFGGSLTGDTQFNGDGTLTSVLEWIKQTGSAGLYPGGFRNGLQVTGERFTSPGFGENPFVTILTLLGAQKARVEFKDGDLDDGDVRVAEVQFTLVPGGLKGRVLAGGTVPGMNFRVNS